MRKLASELGHANHTTVQGWLKRDSIPLERWAEVVQAAERLGQPLTATDLMPAELRDAAA